MPPIRTPGQPSDHWLTARCTPNEHGAAKAVADHAGVPVSDLIRSLIVREAKRHRLWPPREVRHAS